MANQKKREEGINWISFYLFIIQWIDIKMNLGSLSMIFYFKEWLTGSRLIIGAIVSFILIIGGSLSAVIFALKFMATYLIIEILVVYVAYLVFKEDSIYSHTGYNKLSQEEKLLYRNKDGIRYVNGYLAYKDMLKRKKNAQN